MVFQDPLGSLDPRQSVESLLAEGMRAHGLVDATGRREEAAARAARAVGLPAAALHEVPARVLRRPAPAHRHRPRALRSSRELIVADEPV